MALCSSVDGHGYSTCDSTNYILPKSLPSLVCLSELITLERTSLILQKNIIRMAYYRFCK